MKIIPVTSERSQFIKAAAVPRAFAVHRPDAREIRVHTGQHHDANTAHVEAGLRSFNRTLPEGVNLVLIDHVSTLLFVPTEVARKKMLAEGMADDNIHVVRDVMYAAALFLADAGPEEIANALSEHVTLDFGKFLYGDGRSSVGVVKQLSFLN